MNQAFEIAGVGLETQQMALDIIANNIANLNTPTFRRSDVRFSELMMRHGAMAGIETEHGPALASVTARAVLALNQQGQVDRTDRQLDIAIQGDGFIELMGPQGQTLLWRGGTLAVRDDGMLTTADGVALRAPISVPRDAATLEIGADGIVRARSAGSDQSGEIGRIMLVRVDDVASIERLDGGLYRVSDDVQLTETAPGEDGAGTLLQGGVERSNVQLNDEMIRLMIVQRAYAANAQVMQAADQMMAIANNLRR